MFELEVQQAAQLLRHSRYAVALTGAGISTASGIPDFRSREIGMWEQRDPMNVASLISFRHRPDLFFEWMTPLFYKLIEAKPNPAHYALARLEALGIIKSVITQNIDLLHERAGSKNFYEVHGHIRQATCIHCFKMYSLEAYVEAFQACDCVPRCANCRGLIKPNVILFGEQLPMQVIRAAEREVRQCDILLIAGTSLEVYPVADLPRKARQVGAKLILINYEATPIDDVADVTIHGDVAEILPRITEAMEAIE
jgi:NAD-dependent deacetylase